MYTDVMCTSHHICDGVWSHYITFDLGLWSFFPQFYFYCSSLCYPWGMVFVLGGFFCVFYSFWLVGWVNENKLLARPSQCSGACGDPQRSVFFLPYLPPDNQHHLLGCWSHLGYRKPSRGPTLLSSWTSFLFPSLKCGLLSVFTACETDRLVSRMARFLCKTYL